MAIGQLSPSLRGPSRELPWVLHPRREAERESARLGRGPQLNGHDFGEPGYPQILVLGNQQAVGRRLPHRQLGGLHEKQAESARHAVPPATTLQAAQALEGSTNALASEQELQMLVAALESNPSMCRRVAATINARTADEWAAARADAECAAEKRAASADSPVPLPQAWQLGCLHLRSAVPFIGFGLFDNMIMLTVGGTIESTIGVTCGISAMAAAGMGQMASDAAGITLQSLIERFADSLGLPNPRLTIKQQQLPLVRSVVLGSRIFGIILGCCLGMFPVFLMP